MGSVEKTQVGDYFIEVVSFNAIKNGVEVFAKAWDKNGSQIGFGEDGTVETERFVVTNPPMLVSDGVEVQKIVHESATSTPWVEEVVVEKYREDLRAAILDTIVQTLRVKRQIHGPEHIVQGKVGNTTLTAYPNAGSGAAPVDGNVRREEVDETWSTIVAGAGVTATNDGTSGFSIRTANSNSSETSNQFTSLLRGGYGFDTSSVGTDQVDSAVFSMRTRSFSSVATQFGDEDVDIVSFSPASQSAIASGDYANFGTTTFASTALSSISNGTYIDFTLDGSGRAQVNGSGNTYYGTRLESDTDNSFSGLTWTGASSNNLVIDFADINGGTSQDPKLVVEHSVGAPPVSSTLLQSLSYTYDAMGNILTLIDNATTGLGKAITFTYDGLYRLTTASTTAATSTPFLESYTYNALGNLTATSTSGSTYTYGGTDHANPHAATDINGTTLGYDNVGNLTSYGSNVYGWDYRNRLSSTTIGSAFTLYGYDHNNDRVVKGDGTATTTYPNRYYTVTSATTTANIYMPDGTLLATIEGDGTATSTNYVHTDHLGGTNVVTDSSGAVVQAIDYYPYGSKRISSGNDVSQREFIGQVEDPETSLNYLNARYYNNATGQFLSEDPVFWESPGKQNLGNPQSLNSYSYAENNPIVKKDPEGRCAGPLIFVCLGVIGANLGIWTNYAGGVLEQQAQGNPNPYQFNMSYAELGTSGTLGAFELAALPEKRAISGLYAFGSSLAEDRAAGNQSNYGKAFVSAGTSVIAGTFFKNLVGNVPASLASRSQITNQVFQNASGLVANNALGTNYSVPFQTAQSAAKAAGIGNTGGGTFVGTYNFGAGVGTFNFGTGSWVGNAQSTPATIK